LNELQATVASSRNVRARLWHDTAVGPIDVALASCHVLPVPDLDEAPLLRALRAAGLRVEVLGWDDPAADFSSARLTLLRATWNYADRPALFGDWLARTAAATALWNPLPAVRWNLHKSYLLDLARAGVPVTPTHLVPRGSPERLADVAAARGWSDVVVKPAVSAGSRLTVRAHADSERGEAHLRAVAGREDALVQPYLRAVEGHGERALVFIDGELTHAVRKGRRFAGDEEAVTGPFAVSDAEEALARAALAAAPGPVLYARVDVAPGADGQPVLMELELIEPALFFEHGPRALERLVDAVRRRL
jgi:glutathione synthase/RimK-type ligase-like ATP-grasp enzyme